MRTSCLGSSMLNLVAGGVVSVAMVATPAALAQGSASAATNATATAPTGDSKPAGWSFVEKANAAVAITPGTEDLTPILFPAVAAMDPVPSGLEKTDAAMLLSPKSKEWTSAKSWAESANQQAALKALATVTDTKKKFLLAIPYGGGKDVDPAWKKAGLYVELPATGLLQGARYRYRFALERLVALVNVEATRKAEEGKVDEALTLCTQWLRLARIITEREAVRERRWGMNQMMMAAERIRDIAYTYREKLSAEQLRAAADELDERLVQARRIRLPVVERLAAEQLMERVIEEKGEVNAEKFAVTMARLSADARSLNLFGQAAWYRELSKGHAGWFDTRDQIRKVFGGWENRWNVEDLHDALLQIPSDYAKMDKGKFALIELTANEMEGFESLRLDLLTAMAGTRVSLGVAGYERKEKKWPPNVNAIAPTFVRALDTDPYGYDKRFENLNPFLFKVPIRDDVKRERETPKAHEMTVGVGPAGSTTAIGIGRAEIGQPAPELRVYDPVNGEVSLASYKGKVVFLKFWATWCGPCIKSIPHTNEMMEKYASNGVVVLGICDDDGGNEMASVVKDKGIKFPTAIDRTGAMQKAYRVPFWPAGYVIDREGILRAAKFNAYYGEKELLQVLATQPQGTTPPAAAEAPKTENAETSAAKDGEAPVEPAGTPGTGSFKASVDQKDFLLWSVGPDGIDDQAKSVGSGGSDILIWPPIVSLRRANPGM
ncbi:MAG: TlpA family protein disulfide reductase [Phycisphaerales bacterium]